MEEKLANKELMLSIRCLTYNHEPYIRQCLDGFVMQKTNFRFEAIVHDDASTDGTAAIILEYAEKYPDIIKPIIETENQYSKHDGSLGRIINAQMYGKYVAMCEGDDYWTDPYKLQKQIDFLESHPKYSLCFHNAMEHWEDNTKDDTLFVKTSLVDREFSGDEILSSWIIPTASVIIKKDIFFSDLYLKVSKDNRFLAGDNVLFLTAANYGKLYYLNDTMSVYRRHKGGLTFSNTFYSVKRWLEHNKALGDFFGDKYKIISDFIFRSYTEVIGCYLKDKCYFRSFLIVLKVLYCYPLKSIIYIKNHI